MFKKISCLIMSVLLATSVFSSCSSDSSKGDISNVDWVTSGDSSKGEVYILNDDNEVKDDIETLVKSFSEQTGITAKAETVGEYGDDISTELTKDGPTIFLLSNDSKNTDLKNKCTNLRNTEAYAGLSDKSYAFKDEEGNVLALPMAIEAYGIICNKSIFDKYFSMYSSNVGYGSIEEIKSYDALQEVVTDMQSKCSDLGINGVFAGTAINASDNYRIAEELFNVPLYYEYKTEGISDKEELDFNYSGNFWNILSLYVNNSSVGIDTLSTGTLTDAMTEFATGNVAMIQNGTWSYKNLNVEGTIITGDELYYLPVYTGTEFDSTQGLCYVSREYLAVNNEINDDDKAASAEFINWLYTSEDGQEFIVKNYGLVPVEEYDEGILELNPLVKLEKDDMDNDLTIPVDYVADTIPDDEWKQVFTSNILSCLLGQNTWENTVEVAKSGWYNSKQE